MSLETMKDGRFELGLLSSTAREPRGSASKESLTRKRMFLLAIFVVFVFLASPRLFVPASKDVAPFVAVPDFVENNWAQYSPYFPIEPYRSPPQDCRVSQVNILQRHGARFPTTGATIGIKIALGKLQSTQQYTDPRLYFLKTYDYDLGNNDLVPFGAVQSFDAGQEVFQRYSQLVNADNLPFVRASSGERVVLSATNWTAGFAAASHHTLLPKLNVILSEAGNDTLDDKMCPSAGSSDRQTTAWLDTYAPPIVDRLNAAAPNANLTNDDIFSLISVCPFESLAKERKSVFCDIFDASEGAWTGFDYSGDLNKYYGTGYGQPLGPVQGVGYINELLARLTETPVRDNTQTNRTLNSSPVTFPLNRTIYADFSHDNEMIAIYAAMGLFREPLPLNPTHPSAQRVWRVSRLVPFAGRMVVERLECGNGYGGGQFVRVLVNQQVQPLEFCGGDADGLCDLNAFVASQEYARDNGSGDFERCFE